MPNTPVLNEVELKRTFGAAVRHLRNQRGLTQQQLADGADMFRTYLADVERGARNVALTNITRLTAALDASPSAFFKLMEQLAAAERGARKRSPGRRPARQR